MAKKPTYEELKQRGNELERELGEGKHFKKAGPLPPRMAEVSIMAVSDPMNIVDSNFRILWANEARARMHQYSLEQMIGRPCYEVFQRRNEVCEECPVAETLRTGKPCTRERFADRPDGIRAWSETHVWPIFDTTGEITSVVEYARDITERKLAEEALQRTHDELERRVQERTAELAKANEELQAEIGEHKHTTEALRESEEKYKTLTESSLTGIYIHQDGRYVFVNDRFAQIHGYKPEELLGEHYLTLIHPDEKERVKQIGSKRLKGEPAAKRYEVKRLRKDGEAVWCATIAVRIEYRGKPAIMGNIVDINERKQAEQTLRERENELEIKTGNLEEANTALKVLLKKRDEDKIELEEKVLSNVKELVVPYLEKLKKSGLDDRQETYLGILESSLNDIISPFLRHLSSKYLNLTPTQIQIANLVKEGKTTKEIAELLASTRWAIDFHRNNLRKKLGLTNKKANLRTYLLSLT